MSLRESPIAPEYSAIDALQEHTHSRLRKTLPADILVKTADFAAHNAAALAGGSINASARAVRTFIYNLFR